MKQNTAHTAQAQRAAEVQRLVNAKMRENPRYTYDDAFAMVQREHKTLFANMVQPQRTTAPTETRAGASGEYVQAANVIR